MTLLAGPFSTPLMELCRLAFDTGMSLPDKITALIGLGCRSLDMETGALIRLVGSRYEVQAFEGEAGFLTQDEEVDLAGTCFEATLERPTSVGRGADVGSDPDTGPGLEGTGWTSYLGAPIAVDGAVWGTLSFGRRKRGAAPSSPDELEFVELLASWLGHELERQARESELRSTSARFFRILDISVDAVISIDDDGRIVLFNRGAEEMFGYAADEVIGGPLEILMPERSRTSHVDHVAAFGSGPHDARRMGERSEVFGLRKGGEEFPAEASISRLDLDGERIYSVVMRDATERRRHEQSLERTALELARSNRELEEFARVASHDLQEPLRKIRAFGDRLGQTAGDTLDEKGHDYVARMRNAADRMSELIEDLLSYSRVTSRAADMTTVDLSRIAHQVVEDLEGRLQETAGTVVLEPLPSIDADPTQMRQLLQNLIGNALKYHRDGVPPHVVVTGGATRQEGWVEVRVEDNGIGFDPRYSGRIFELFQRLHAHGRFGGTGMGLAICRKIVERHGGRIWTSSTPGEGSTFVVELPQKPETLDAGKPADA